MEWITMIFQQLNYFGLVRPFYLSSVLCSFGMEKNQETKII